jgi:predicted nucleic-acid-binding protein
MEKDTVWQALADYRQGKGDFSDCYLGRANEHAGSPISLTFDKTPKGESTVSGPHRLRKNANAPLGPF